jgi:hypothetical protein
MKNLIIRFAHPLSTSFLFGPRTFRSILHYVLPVPWETEFYTHVKQRRLFFGL